MNRNIDYYGIKEDLPAVHNLKAGPLSLLYENGCLRHIKIGQIELIRMIYFAVRDENWQTIEGTLHDVKIDVLDDSFDITFKSKHIHRQINFVFTGRIRGDLTGKVIFKIDGKAKTTFKKNRIGFCVLHPIKECTGNIVRIYTANDEIEEGIFPVAISPNQPFKNIQKMRWWPDTDLQADISFEGDIFEMEDQRNWTDASYKTYCTPLDLPFPVEIKAGSSLSQKITFHVKNLSSTVHVSDTRHVLKIQSVESDLKLPEIGLGPASETRVLSDVECILLKELNLDFIRVDIDMCEPAERTQNKIRLHNAINIGLPIHLGMYFGNNPLEELSDNIDLFDLITVSKCLLFNKHSVCTPDRLIDLIHPVIKRRFPSIQVGAGSNAFFTELNRFTPDLSQVDFTFYSINPQVHAFDNLSLIENLQAQADTVLSCKKISKGLPVDISPITFKPRFNPDATGPERLKREGELPTKIDPRQMALFGAGWTLGSIYYLSGAGVDSIAYYEPTGCLGIIQGDRPSVNGDMFIVNSGDIFPMYFIFYWLSHFKDTKLAITESSDPLKFNAISFRAEQNKKVIICNHSGDVLNIHIESDHSFNHILCLDENNITDFKRDPHNVLKTRPEVMETSNSVRLLPYGIAVLA